MDKHHRYALSPTQLFWACWSRENVLVSRNLFQYGFRFFVTMFMVRPALLPGCAMGLQLETLDRLIRSSPACNCTLTLCTSCSAS